MVFCNFHGNSCFYGGTIFQTALGNLQKKVQNQAISGRIQRLTLCIDALL
ncbi:hypothetical protein HMPREF0604_00611 [Neisseria mucosa C102]|uniref:Uncharacterized protein n=1 Tax=Neisseria mucosa C102 TaxID=435832 RepID=A0ABP2KE59_NEIMU|nr:hypothetical protein HMPREF0604_00611 [Neisseria mucosa C102]